MSLSAGTSATVSVPTTRQYYAQPVCKRLRRPGLRTCRSGICIFWPTAELSDREDYGCLKVQFCFLTPPPPPKKKIGPKFPFLEEHFQIRTFTDMIKFGGIAPATMPLLQKYEKVTHISFFALLKSQAYTSTAAISVGLGTDLRSGVDKTS